MIGANISKFISDVVSLIENKTTSDIIDVSNESSKEGIRIVLELAECRCRAFRKPSLQEDETRGYFWGKYACHR